MRSLLFASLLLGGCIGGDKYCTDHAPFLRGGTTVTAAAMGAPAAQLRVDVTASMERDTGYDEENSVHSPRCFSEAVSGLSLTARSSDEVALFEDLGNGEYRTTLVGYEASYTVEHENGMEVVAMPKPFEPVVDWPSGQDLTLRWTVDAANLGRITLVSQAPDGSTRDDNAVYPNIGSLVIPAARLAQPGTYRLTVTHTSDDGYGWERTFARAVDVVSTP